MTKPQIEQRMRWLKKSLAYNNNGEAVETSKVIHEMLNYLGLKLEHTPAHMVEESVDFSQTVGEPEQKAGVN